MSKLQQDIFIFPIQQDRYRYRNLSRLLSHLINITGVITILTYLFLGLRHIRILKYIRNLKGDCDILIFILLSSICALWNSLRSIHNRKQQQSGSNNNDA